jgi:hypothetical protein
MYSVERIQEIQQRYTRNPAEVRAYIRLPFYAQLLSPLGHIRYETAHRIWQVVNIVALAGFLWLWSPRTLPMIACCWYFPTWVNFSLAQDMPIVLFVFSLSFYLYERGRPATAGIVFALCSIKIQLFLLAPLFICARRAWRFGAGLFAGGAFLVVLSFIAAGPDWPYRQLTLLRANEAGQASYSNMANLVGLFVGHDVPGGAVFALLCSVALAASVFLMIRKVPDRLAFGLVPAAGLAVAPHSFLYDCMLLLPGFAALADGDNLRPEWYVASVTTLGATSLLLTSSGLSFIAQVSIVGSVLFLIFRSKRTLHVENIAIRN